MQTTQAFDIAVHVSELRTIAAQRAASSEVASASFFVHTGEVAAYDTLLDILSNQFDVPLASAEYLASRPQAERVF